MSIVAELLAPLRAAKGERLTRGLPDDMLAEFEVRDPLLAQAANEAIAEFGRVKQELPELVDMDEAEQVRVLREGLLSFYGFDKANPYVALGARGPWIVTLKGAVIYDCGGYGILGLGHGPPTVLAALAQPQVMANVMTGNPAHLRFIRALQNEIGQRRRDGCPFSKFVAMNSGSEAVAVAARVSDANAKVMTDPGGPHENARIRKVALRGAFHGRTDRPARFSHSTAPAYERHLASFRERADLIVVPANDTDALTTAFTDATARGEFIEALFMEPVMGEGNPGLAITPDFYARARELTREHGSLLLVDSIQAGLRATGYLSVVDYPGFESLDPPDMEAYSKALNAGQYPLSVLALTETAASLFRRGTYGNTMTANPRGLDIAVSVLDAMTPALRANVARRGAEFLEMIGDLASELDGPIVSIQGTGLLFSCELADDIKAAGAGSAEDAMRRAGVGVIHGGRNSLRFTPRFGVTPAEMELVVGCLREQLAKISP